MDMSLPLIEQAPANNVIRIEAHPGYKRVFREDELTVGVTSRYIWVPAEVFISVSNRMKFGT